MAATDGRSRAGSIMAPGNRELILFGYFWPGNCETIYKKSILNPTFLGFDPPLRGRCGASESAVEAPFLGATCEGTITVRKWGAATFVADTDDACHQQLLISLISFFWSISCKKRHIYFKSNTELSQKTGSTLCLLTPFCPTLA